MQLQRRLDRGALHGLGRLEHRQRSLKRGLMTNAKRWWWHDDELLASYANKYCAVSRVKFTQEGCVA